MKTKKLGGARGRAQKHRNRIIDTGFILIGILLFLAIGSYTNDVTAGAIGGIMVSSSLKFATIGMFGLRPLFHRDPDGGGGGGDKTDEEKLLEKFQAKLDGMKTAFGNHESITALKSQLSALETKFTDMGVDKYKSEIERLSTEFTALQESGKKSATRKSIAEQLKAYMVDNKDKWESFKRGETKAFTLDLDFKAAATMLESTHLGSSAYLPYREIVPGFTDIARNMPFLERFINSSGTSSARIVWVNKTNPEGNAAMTAEGTLKSLIDFKLETEESSAKKVTDFIKVSTEMLEDVDFIAGAIENELRYQVDIKVDEQLLSGDGTGQNLKGIIEYASAYSLTTINTDNANNADAIIAAKTQIETQNFIATHAFVNPIDKANMKLTKTTTGERLVSLNTDEDTGVTVVSSNQIPVGYVLVCDPSKYIKRDLKNFTITYGLENDDFTNNLVTILGERRLHAYASDNNTGAFVYDTFNNIKTALTLP